MATTLPTDYTDATWTGNRKYKMINNSDGTVSFEDVTEYTNKENSFFGASDANAMNAAVNELNTNLAYSAKNISNISGVTAYAYKSGHVVNFYIRDFGTAISVGSKIATLPSGWIPSYEFYIRNAVDNANGYLDVTANGEMYLRTALSSITSLSYVLFSGSCIVP